MRPHLDEYLQLLDRQLALVGEMAKLARQVTANAKAADKLETKLIQWQQHHDDENAIDIVDALDETEARVMDLDQVLERLGEGGALPKPRPHDALSRRIERIVQSG